MKKHVLINGLMVIITGLCTITNINAFTAVTSGNWSNAATWGGVAPGSNVSNQDISIPSGITVTMDMNVTFSGLLNSFSVDGVLSGTGINWLTITSGTFTGSGSIDIKKIVFDGLLITSSFNGDMNVGTMINSGATLTFTSVVNIIDTLSLEAGSIALGTGANMSPKNNAMIVVDGGTISSTGGIFNSTNEYSVMYIGGSKTTGIELNTTSLKHLHIALDNNSQSITLDNNLGINGEIHLDSGRFNINGRQLTLKGDLKVNMGTFTSNASTNIIIQRNGSVSDGLAFSAGSSVNDLTIDISGGGDAEISDDLTISGTLRLLNGDFKVGSGAALTMGANSTIHMERGNLSLSGGSFNGTAIYDVEYMGDAEGSGLELSGTGLRNLTVNTDSSGNQIKLESDVTVNGDLNLYKGILHLNNKTLVVNGGLDEAKDGMFAGSVDSKLRLNIASAVSDTLYFDETGSRNKLSELTVNHTGGGNIVLGSELSIDDKLDLTAGSVVLMNDNLVIESAGVISNYSNSKYIMTNGDGKLQMHVNSSAPYVMFPVGTSSHYAPASIQQKASGTSGNFMVKAMNGVFAEGTSGYNNANSESVVNKTWIIESATGITVDMNLKLGWTAAAEVNGFNRNRAYISHYHNSDWDTYNKAAATSGANGTFELERMNISTLSPFSVADSLAGLSISNPHIASANVVLYPNPTADVISVQVNVPGDFLYEISDMAGHVLIGETKEQIIKVSDLSSGCYYIKAIDAATRQAVTVPFIKY